MSKTRRGAIAPALYGIPSSISEIHAMKPRTGDLPSSHGIYAGDLAAAIEVFVRGFAFARSFTHPFLTEQVEHGIWKMRDADRKSGEYRSEEYVAHRVAPEDAARTAQAHTRGRYKICAIVAAGEADGELRSQYKALGCRLMGTEPFMVHRLKEIPTAEEPFPIVRVTTVEQADRLARAARSKQILPRHLTADPPPMRQYMTVDGDRPVGWVGAVSACGAAWCQSMYVAPEYRRRGIARALMNRMLRDDQEAGTSANVLLASHTGAKLYTAVGYEMIGTLLLYAQPKPRRGGRSLDTPESARVD